MIGKGFALIQAHRALLIKFILAVGVTSITIFLLSYLMVRYELLAEDTYLRHGDRLMERNERQLALRAYEKALAVGGDSLRAWKGLAKGYLSLDEDSLALDALNAALRYDEDNAWLWKAKGDAHLAMEDSIQALASYSTAFSLNPNDLISCESKGRILSGLRRKSEAIDAFKVCASADSAKEFFAHFWGFIGLIHIQEKRYESSAAALDTALQQNPEYMLAWVWRGVLFMQTDQLEQAIDALNKAVSLGDSIGVGFYTRARVRARRGEKELAIEDLTAAIRLDSTYAAWARNESELAFYFDQE